MFRKNLNARTFALLLLLLSLPACTTHNLTRLPLPPEIALNQTAARGNQLIITIRLESGEELPFGIDTGSPMTVFDKSLESKLGPRLGDATMAVFGATQKTGFYKTPRLYLQNTRLKTGPYSVVVDVSPIPAGFEKYRPMGILGMDCLQHYCVQLDFQSGKIRFLNPHELNVKDLGVAFPIHFSSQGQSRTDLVRPYIQSANLLSEDCKDLMIDTGYRVDGAVDSKFFHQKISEQRNQPGDAVRGDNGRFWFSKSTWNSNSYTNLLLGEGGNLIGLGFLARHLVTLDFPDRVMYLKQNSTGPLMDDTMNDALAFLTSLKENGQLPGWSRQEEGTIYLEPFPNRDELDGRKKNDSSDYHYQVGRAPASGAWQLQKAWRTDPNGEVIEEYPASLTVGWPSP